MFLQQSDLAPATSTTKQMYPGEPNHPAPHETTGGTTKPTAYEGRHNQFNQRGPSASRKRSAQVAFGLKGHKILDMDGDDEEPLPSKPIKREPADTEGFTFGRR